MSDYIRFETYAKKLKTKVYGVVNIKSGFRIGIIKWYSAWRQYCFYPDEETIFNTECMQYIIDFIKELMEKRKT